MRILVVEDEATNRDFLRRSLEDNGYETTLASTAQEAEEAAKSSALEGGVAIDGVILDLMLPDGDGISLIRRMKAAGLSAPVLILSAKRSVDERVFGLETGGDDYLTKPYAIAELMARLRNMVRRTETHAQEQKTVLRVQDITLDLLRREARRGEQVLELTTREFSLLEFLCRNAGRMVTRSMILDQVWGMRIEPETNVVDVHIYRLRNKMERRGERPLLRTIRGMGYVLQDR
jgi:two-component system copper resistance phosphate regulon response regulator CusR